MQLHRFFAASATSLGKQRQLNHGGVQQREFAAVLETEPVSGRRKLLAAGQKDLEYLFEERGWRAFVCPSQTETAEGIETQVTEPASLGQEDTGDAPQAAGAGELPREHGHELCPGRKGAAVRLGWIIRRRRSNSWLGKTLSNWPKTVLRFTHSLDLLDLMNFCSNPLYHTGGSKPFL